MSPVVRLLLMGLLTTGCQPTQDPEPTVESTMQAVRTGPGGFTGLDILVTDSQGTAIPCERGELSVAVEVSEDGGQNFTDIDDDSVVVRCTPEGHGDLALVVDNSGSQDSSLGLIANATRAISERILSAGGRISITRVSTDANVLVPLTDDTAAIDEAIDGMFVNRGWTALYDGIRMANETLGGELRPIDEGQIYGNATEFCTASRRLGIIALTDGKDNNSSDQQAYQIDTDSYPGDGIDTYVEDLFNLRVDSITTPIYTVGVGDEPSHAVLENLTETTGGSHTPVDTFEQVPEVLSRLGEYFDSAHQVCADLPLRTCGPVTIRVSYNWSDGAEYAEGSQETEVDIPCPTEPRGRTATVLLTMSDPGIPTETARSLIEKTVKWVSPETAPRVLVVRDDNHHNEAPGDTEFVRAQLAAVGFDVTMIEEPADGITMSDVDGYDVVWVSNPGYPLDDAQTYDTLLEASEAGLGAVLQGDDMAQIHGNAFAMTPLTGLEFVNNGTRTCGQRTDNRSGHRHAITVDDGSHPMTAGLGGEVFYYGDDIDQTIHVAPGSTVLATATLEGDDQCEANKPVIIATDRLVD